MTKTILIDGCNVAECDRYCKFDNRNEPNKCYSYISEGYSDCKPKEYQCFFYVKEIEKQLQRAKAELEQYKKSKQANEYNLKYKQALKKIEEIAYTTDFDIVDIQEIVDEVLK